MKSRPHYDADILKRLCAYVRGGARPESAAEACDLSADEFSDLMEIPEFAAAVRKVEAEVQVAAEVELKYLELAGELPFTPIFGGGHTSRRLPFGNVDLHAGSKAVGVHRAG